VVYGREEKKDFDSILPCKLTNDKLHSDVHEVALNAYRALGCRGLARIDIRKDAHGCPHFIECNAIPGLVPDFSDTVVTAKLMGMTYNDFIWTILKSVY
jgi:D-alanine-D-alanine ligase